MKCDSLVLLGLVDNVGHEAALLTGSRASVNGPQHSSTAEKTQGGKCLVIDQGMSVSQERKDVMKDVCEQALETPGLITMRDS